MKPKKRKEQNQTARMVLRNHDHRDAIFDQKYHNMIYLNKSEKKDEGIRFNPDSNVDYQPLSKEEQSEIDAEIEKVM